MRLPTPDPAFRWVDAPFGPVLLCVPLEAVAQHAFTTKQQQLAIDAAQFLGVAPEQIVRVRQVHGRAVRLIRRGVILGPPDEEPPEGDAIVSNEPGLALAVSVADCTPILIADARSGAAAAVHAGWRGTCARVAPAAIDTMARELGVHPADCMAAIGPSIGPDDYEVGLDLLDSFRDAGHAPADLDRWFRRRPDSRPTLDLWSATRDQLAAAGVQRARIFTCRLSTKAHPDLFESFRAAGARAGRMAGVIVVPARGAPPAEIGTGASRSA